MTLSTYSHDIETARAGGFDIVEPGYWVRPDNATIRKVLRRRGDGWQRFYPPFIAIRPDDMRARFYTLTEAVEWIGGTPVTVAYATMPYGCPIHDIHDPEGECTC